MASALEDAAEQQLVEETRSTLTHFIRPRALLIAELEQASIETLRLAATE